MQKRILINGITIDDANLVPLLLKIKNWQKQGVTIDFFCNIYTKKRIDCLKIVSEYGFIELKGTNAIKSRIHFIFESLKRNFIALFYVNKIRFFEYDVIYTISPVLDLIILPVFLKRLNKKIKWVTVFDNTVPLFSNGKIIAGNKFIRILAWIFFKISLFLLKKADFIFVIKPDLRKYFLERNFNDKKLILTGNGVERNFIEKAKTISGLDIDALFIGRINEAKGIYDMLEVIKIIKRRYPKFNLYIMGRGDDVTEKKFKETVKKENLRENVYFIGYKTGQEKFDIIKSSKIFLFLSETESVPISPLEAVCSGLKTLVYDLDAYNMYKKNEVIIFKKNDCNAVAKKILEIFDKKDFDNTAGRQLLDQYSWDNIAEIESNFF